MNRNALLPPLAFAAALALSPAATADAVTGANLECSGVTYTSASWSDASPPAWRTSHDPRREDAYVPPRLVWVDPASNIYHCSGDLAYGRTRNGEYMSENDAKANGARAFQGRKCG